MRGRDRLFLVAVDAVLSLAAIYLAIFIRFENLEINSKWFDGTRTLAYLALTMTVLGLYAQAGLYRHLSRYAGLNEALVIFTRTTLAVGLFELVALATGGVLLSRSILLIAWLLMMGLVFGYRIALRLAYERNKGPGPTRQVIIVGVNDAGENLLREINRSPGYTVLGFVDNNPDKHGVRVHGTPVLGAISLLADTEVDVVVLTEQRPDLVREVVKMCNTRKTEVRRLPDASALLKGSIEVSSIQKVDVEDLLERAPVQLDIEPVRGIIAGQVVMVTGAGGSIGGEICRQVARLGPARLVLVGRGENSIYEISMDLKDVAFTQVIADVRDRARMERVMDALRPRIVFHAAAHKHVPLMEANITEAVSVNTLGTQTMMELCEAYGVERFILLSTDKAVTPTSAMGASKRMAELLLLARSTGPTRFSAVRFGNVLGSRGSVVPTFRRQIAAGGPVTITHQDMTRYFMTIPEAVTLVLQAAAMASSGAIYILDMGQPVRILDLARNMIRLSGFEPDLDIQIDILGTRPGEKLTESLQNPNETATPTDIPKIMRVAAAGLDLSEAPSWVSQMQTALQSGDDTRVRDLLMKVTATPD